MLYPPELRAHVSTILPWSRALAGHWVRDMGRGNSPFLFFALLSLRRGRPRPVGLLAPSKMLMSVFWMRDGAILRFFFLLSCLFAGVVRAPSACSPLARC